MLSSSIISIYNFGKNIIYPLGIAFCLILLTGCTQREVTGSGSTQLEMLPEYAYIFKIDTRAIEKNSNRPFSDGSLGISNNMTLVFDGSDVLIDRGDKAITKIDSPGPHKVSHTYEEPGIYTIALNGNFSYVKSEFETRRKIIDVIQWGNRERSNMSNMFNGSLIHTFSALDTPNINNVTNMSNLFANTPHLKSKIGSRDTNSVTDMSDTFYRSINFNQDISNRDTSNVTDMSNMFGFARNFNQDISNRDTGKVTNMSRMFINAKDFNQNIGSRDITSVTDMRDMFTNTTLSSQNYDSLLIGRAAQDVQPAVEFDAGDSIYCSAEAIIARETLISTYGWTITDGGQC